jgi:hypothetical protein
MTHAEAAKIMNTPPTELDRFWFKTRGAWLEYRRIVGPGGMPERRQVREHTIHGVSNWEHCG